MILSGLLAVAPAPVRAENEITVGRSAAGRLKVELEFAQPIVLEPSIFPGIAGYATGQFGVHSALFDEPANDFFQLSGAADIRLLLVAKDPGMEVWNDTGTAFLGTNGTFLLGIAPFDTHPLWNLISGSPGQEYALTLKIHDLNGIHAESAPFAVSFTASPPPGPFELKVAPAGANQVTLSWSTNALGWKIETAYSPNATDWETQTNIPGVTSTNFTLNVPTLESQRFFRLRRP